MKQICKLFVCIFLLNLFALQLLFADRIPEGMILIPMGSFEMGIDIEDIQEIIKMGEYVGKKEMNAEWWFSDEIPIHLVQVDSFYMDAKEITNHQFSEFIIKTGYQTEGDWQKYYSKKRKDHPVVNVSWNDAEAYAKWAGKRLPTEEEWEYAAKGGKDVKWFPWGNEPDKGVKANYNHKGEGFWGATWNLIFGKIKTKSVGSYSPNSFGLFDMCGNVSEWTNSTHEPYPNGPTDSWIYSRHGYYDKESKPIHGKVYRGGSWESCDPVGIRVNIRNGVMPSSANWNRGFRCVKSIRDNTDEFDSNIPH